MTYELAIGDRAYSSWSLRGWLLFDVFGISVRTRKARLYSEELPELLAEFKPSRTVPVMRTPDGIVVPDSLAMAEELASRHPKVGILPTDPKARAVARTLMAEMHAGFTALRNHCPMNLRVSYTDCGAPDAVRCDIARLQYLWADAKVKTGGKGPWLCGEYSAADAFFAPVASRIAGYNLDVSDEAAEYVATHLAHPSFRQWRAMGHADGPDQDFYFRSYTRRPWPGPAPMPAKPAPNGPSVNETCPYSGDPVTHFMELGGRVWGFCNAFCRDKTVADAEAWPKFMALYNS